jgi:hypothetical protein
MFALANLYLLTMSDSEQSPFVQQYGYAITGQGSAVGVGG